MDTHADPGHRLLPMNIWLARPGAEPRQLWSAIRRADSHWSRLRGLLGRRHLGEQEGLWLLPCNQVHSHFMLMAIDILFLDREGTLLQCETLPPWRFSSHVPKAHSILEVAAGSVERLDLRPGDRLILEAE